MADNVQIVLDAFEALFNKRDYRKERRLLRAECWVSSVLWTGWSQRRRHRQPPTRHDPKATMKSVRFAEV